MSVAGSRSSASSGRRIIKSIKRNMFIKPKVTHATVKSEVKKEIKKEMLLANVNLKEGCRRIHYKGNSMPPIIRTYFSYNNIAKIPSTGQLKFKLNSLWDIQRTGAPSIFPGWYHALLSSSLYNNYLVYSVKMKLTVISYGTAAIATPYYVIVYPASDQDPVLGNFNNAMVVPGIKYYPMNNQGAGTRNEMTIYRKWKLPTVVASDYDVSYSALYNADPTNGIYAGVEFYDTAGAIISSQNISYNVTFQFDAVAYGLKQPSVG